jgi:hypothetical protein
MADNLSDLVLEGNTAATLLQEIFARDITIAQTECQACGSRMGVGSLRLCAAEMEAVLRCSHCDGVIIRATDTPQGWRLEMEARYLAF